MKFKIYIKSFSFVPLRFQVLKEINIQKYIQPRIKIYNYLHLFLCDNESNQSCILFYVKQKLFL